MGAHLLLLDVAPQGELEWSDFDHIADARDHAEALLRGALRAGARGVNILVHGEPGTGKTEFCRTLAERLGVTLYTVGESDDDGDEPSRRERLAELRFAQRLLAESTGALLLFDEMEDLLNDRAAFGWMNLFRSRRAPFRAEGSKVFMNRLLEQTPVPTLWTSNVAGDTCEAVLRRMMFAVELRLPPSRVRARIWSRQLAKHDIASDESDARALASEFEVTPGVASGVAAAAELVEGGGLDAVRCGVRSLARVLSREKPPQNVPGRFDPALVRADPDLVSLANRLAEAGPGPMSFCLQGAPGTGKSAFVRHLAERMGIEVVQKRASDLVSMWVGDTEKQIAAAFAEARDAGSFLVFDEADSLLADRRFAVRSWEVSRVNEMLTWMESHPLPFACTTNFREHLDPATLRRFVFKLALDYLSPEQVEAAVSEVLRTCAAQRARPACGAHARGLRGGSAEGGGSRSAWRCGGSDDDAPGRVRRKAGPASAYRVPCVGRVSSTAPRACFESQPAGTMVQVLGVPGESHAMRYEPVSKVMHLAIRLQGARLGITVDEIEAELNVSRRTAERLRDAVEQSFGPLEEVETGERRKRWRLRSDPLRELIRVAPEELAELESAAEGLDRAGLTDRAKAIRTVADKLRALWRPRTEVDTADELEVLMRTEGLAMRAGPRPHLESGLLPLLREALTTFRVVEFEYRARTTRATSRQRVEPYGVLYGNRAFLVGPTDWADDPRLWRLDRIREARILEQAFDRDPEFDLRSYAERAFGTFQEEPVDVVLRFDEDAAHDARNFLFHPTQTSEWNQGGTLTVRFRAGGIEEMCWHLITWGESVTVEKPLHLRRRLAEMGESLASHHGYASTRLQRRSG